MRRFGLFMSVLGLLLTACFSNVTDAGRSAQNGPDMMDGDQNGMMDDEGPMPPAGGQDGAQMERGSGTAWGSDAFRSNGQRIYFTATTEDGERITYSGGPQMGMMMMGGQLSCASCHGPDGRGGVHTMHMEEMFAPDIRWSTLSEHGHEEAGEDEHSDGDEHAEDEHAEEEEGYTLEMFRMAVVGGEHPNGEPLNEDMPRWNIDDGNLRDLADYLKTLP